MSPLCIPTSPQEDGLQAIRNNIPDNETGSTLPFHQTSTANHPLSYPFYNLLASSTNASYYCTKHPQLPMFTDYNLIKCLQKKTRGTVYVLCMTAMADKLYTFE